MGPRSGRIGGQMTPSGAGPGDATVDYESLFRLDGQATLIAGGYGGIGRVLSEMFAAAGARVAVAGRSLEKAEAAAPWDGAIGVELDVADRGSVERAVKTVLERFGSLDVVVNCASIMAEAKAQDFPEETWRQIVDVNLTGAFLLSQGVAKPMLESGRGGRIVHFSSTRGVQGGRRGFAAYSASKGGLISLVRQLATEWAPTVTVNAVAPGFVATDLVDAAMSDVSFQQMLLNRIPLRRFGQPIEIAAAALFLAAPAASFITGQVVFVDGGVTASS